MVLSLGAHVRAKGYVFQTITAILYHGHSRNHTLPLSHAISVNMVLLMMDEIMV